jgi:molecular chaperone GrpE (heat shock protein)
MQENLEKLARSMRGVEDHLLKVAEAYQRIAQGEKRKKQAYDQLYEELRQYKDDFLLRAQKPLFMDIILLYDGLSRTIRTFEDVEEEALPKAEVLESLRHSLEEVQEVLYRRDIEPIEERPETLQIEYQKPVQRIETDNPEEDREVVSIVRDGFRMNGAILRPQEVVVKRCLKEREAQ